MRSDGNKFESLLGAGLLALLLALAGLIVFYEVEVVFPLG
ncbi:hypothetical protein BQ8482_180341 [Mesorhizobium delmotii]|uniref:Uncharacterized protein n=1 Tax=Mesorhizobium delmotii TaxID=1631247 RepID=A0A2P9AJ39_9HYPH|nr:hypothetical protein BQ8482_180341 [Mesorhizobium delmotii]